MRAYCLPDENPGDTGYRSGEYARILPVRSTNGRAQRVLRGSSPAGIESPDTVVPFLFSYPSRPLPDHFRLRRNCSTSVVCPAAPVAPPGTSKRGCTFVFPSVLRHRAFPSMFCMMPAPPSSLRASRASFLPRLVRPWATRGGYIYGAGEPGAGRSGRKILFLKSSSTR